MYSVEEALSTILARVQRLPVEQVTLLESLGRSLAEDCIADMPMPSFDNSAVDGYAVHASDTLGSAPTNPILLRTLSEIPAGVVSQQEVTQGTAARIMTGAPLPSGADAVVMIEDTRSNPNGVEILEEAATGQHIRRRGSDYEAGTLILSAGTRIRAAEVGLLASLGRPIVPVYRSARVAVISTGDEVVEIEAGKLPPPGKIRNSNRYLLAALVRETGGVVSSQRHIPDNPIKTEAALRECVEEGCDVIITAGGVSVGDRDYVKPALEKLGSLELWQVAMKPGKPLAFGSIGNTVFFGLPGNPVSALVTFELFVSPALRKMAGQNDACLTHERLLAISAEPITHTPGRREYVRAITALKDGRWQTCPTGTQGSGNLHSMAQANSLIIVPEDATGVEQGETVSVLMI